MRWAALLLGLFSAAFALGGIAVLVDPDTVRRPDWMSAPAAAAYCLLLAVLAFFAASGLLRRRRVAYWLLVLVAVPTAAYSIWLTATGERGAFSLAFYIAVAACLLAPSTRAYLRDGSRK